MACVPASLTIRSAIVIVESAALFWRNVRLVAPANPAPVSVSARFAVPRAALAGATPVTTGSIVTATGAASEVAGVGADAGETMTLTGTALGVAAWGGVGGATCTLTGGAAPYAANGVVTIRIWTAPLRVGSSVRVAISVTPAGEGTLPGVL